MSHEITVQEYYRVLQTRDYDAILRLFTQDAVVKHPIFGTIAATDFFNRLLNHTKSHKIHLINMMTTLENQQRIATYLRAEFTTKSNSEYDEEGVHIYDFSLDGRIEKITVIIDTYPFRSEYNRD
jgi:ketosteroid isomerase-like protein